MGATVAVPDPAKEASTRFLREQFRRYYESTKPTLPDRFGLREVGFMFWTAGIVQRHLGFAREEELRSFLTTRVPAHAYYSSAYYETPNAATMEEKGWLGADLIFDLDADHLPDAKNMTYPEMLEAIRGKIIKLHDQFLVDDFGFDESHMRIVFSGGRGYHIHVTDPAVLDLGTHERREIVDWIFGTGLEYSKAFQESVYDTRQYQGRVYSKKRIKIAEPADRVGWTRKLVESIRELARILEPLEKQKALGFLSSFEGTTKQQAADLWENLFAPRGPTRIRGIDRLSLEGQIEILTDKNVQVMIGILRQIHKIESDTYEGVAIASTKPFGDTDQPVTSDIKRLIRMPRTLHGKTGLAVVPLTRDALDDFRPLRDAVPKVWTDDSVRMHLKNKINMEISGEAFNLAPGVNDVPQFLAIFLAAR